MSSAEEDLKPDDTKGEDHDTNDKPKSGEIEMASEIKLTDDKPKPEETETTSEKKIGATSNGPSKEDEDNEEPEFPPGSAAETLLASLDEDDLKRGLTTAEAERRQQEFGFNEVQEVKESAWLKYFSRYLGLVPLLM